MKIKIPKKGIAVFDLHYPHHHRELWNNIIAYIEDLQPDYFIFGGDNMNMDAVDHWKAEKGQKRPLEGKRLREEYLGFQLHILDRLESVLPKDCIKVYMRGNHENWVEQYVDRHPEIEGLLEIENNLNLKEWTDIPYGHTYKAGKLHFHHGEYVSKYSAAKTVEVYGRNILYGHGHTFQTYTKITPIDCESHMATQVPCACKMNPDYMKNRPSAWLNGFAAFYIEENGNFNHYTVVATDGHFTAPNGVYY